MQSRMEPEDTLLSSQALSTVLSKSTVTLCDAVPVSYGDAIRHFFTTAMYE
jgi:hypothetical protein